MLCEPLVGKFHRSGSSWSEKHVDVRSLDLFRVTISDQSLISQLYPVTFTPTTQSFPTEQSDAAENSTSNGKPSTTAFRSIIPKVLTKNVLSSTSDNVQHLAHSSTNGLLSAGDSQEQSSFYQHLTTTYRSLSWVTPCLRCERCTHPSCCVCSRSVETSDLSSFFDEDLPVHSLFFSVSGSTYRPRPNATTNTSTSARFRVCLTVPVLEHLHEVYLLLCQACFERIEESLRRWNWSTIASWNIWIKSLSPSTIQSIATLYMYPL